MILNILLPVLAGAANALGNLPTLCITEPPLLLVAGESIVQATNHDPTIADCRAAIYFTNPAFAPITYPYGAGSCRSGGENASFLVPPGVPNGDAFITWSCGTYTRACLRAVISKGSGDSALSALIDGSVECEPFRNCDDDVPSASHQLSNSTDTPPRSTSERSTLVATPEGGGGSNQPPMTPTRAGATIITPPTLTPEVTPKERTTTESATSIEALSDPPSSILTEEGDSGGDFAKINSSSRPMTPAIAGSLVTVTRTITTLITTTLTAAREFA